MKTIFITCFRGIIARNILATRAFESLRERRNLRIIIIAPPSRAAHAAREFGGSNVLVEAVPLAKLAGLNKILWVLATNLLASGTRGVQRLAKWERDRNFLDYWVSGLVGWLGRFRPVRAIFRWGVRAGLNAGEFEYLFDKYSPDLVFAADIYELEDAKLVHLAKKRRVKTIGMVRSWDNITSKTLLMVMPERMAVNSAHIQKELEKYGDVPAGMIFICGVPHYDHYRPEGRTSREDFFSRFGLDPRKKLILFTPPSDTYIKHDPVAVEILKALEEVNDQVLVRLSLVGKTDLSGYAKSDKVALDEPANSPDFIDVYMNRATDRHLADSIYHSDLVITWASTMIVDAAVFDKPIILVGFDAAARPYGRSIRQYYDYDHQRHVIETGGVRLARSRGELVDLARKYLADPALDRGGRRAIVREYCGDLDGRAGERLGKFILDYLDNRYH